MNTCKCCLYQLCDPMKVKLWPLSHVKHPKYPALGIDFDRVSYLWYSFRQLITAEVVNIYPESKFITNYRIDCCFYPMDDCNFGWQDPFVWLYSLLEHVFNIDSNKKCFLNSKSAYYSRIIFEGSYDTEDFSIKWNGFLNKKKTLK